MQRIGLEPEGRKYTPHVTLARLRDSSNRDVADYLSARGHFRSQPFPVSRFVLFSSRNSVGGGPYVVEASYPLGVPCILMAADLRSGYAALVAAGEIERDRRSSSI